MKKILTTITAAAILATSAFSAEIKESTKSKFPVDRKIESCNTFNEINYIFKNEYKNIFSSNATTNYVYVLGAAEGVERYLIEQHGKLSTSFLKNAGVGINREVDYKTFLINYFKFLEEISKNNLMKNYVAKVISQNTIQEELTSEVFFLLNTIKGKWMNSYILSKDFLLTQYVLNSNLKVESAEKKQINNLIKYIFLGDINKAIDEVKKWNYNNIKTYCNKVGVKIN